MARGADLEKRGAQAQDEPHRPSAVAAKRDDALARAIAVLVSLVVVESIAALAGSWRGDAGNPAFDGTVGEVTMLSIDGTYRIGDGEWRPVDGPSFEAALVGVQSVTVCGRLSHAVPEGERVNLRLSSTSCVIRVNGMEAFSFDGRSGTDPASEPMLGWVGFTSPGITEGDQVEVELRSASRWSSLGDYELTFRTLNAGDADSLRRAMTQLFFPMLACGAAVLCAGVVLLLVASLGHLVGVPKERGGMLFAVYVLLGGVWIFFCFDYVTLFIPHPQFTATVSLLAQDAMPLALVGYVIQRSAGTLRRFARVVLAAMAAVEATAIALRVAGVCSLFDANILIVTLFVTAEVAVVGAFAFRAVRSSNREMREAAVVVLPCTVGSLFEALSFLVWGVSTGFALTAGIAVSAAFRFVALYAYARKQVELAERARRAEQELVQSRVAIALSQIQPHFLYNALATIQYLCTEDPPLAARTVDDFARYLRGNMDSLTNDRPIPFARELEHLRHYVAIEQLRFPHIDVEFDVEEEQFLLPALTVQPLVENAVRHGLRNRAQDGTVTVSTRSGEGCFLVCVSDNGMGFERALDAPDIADAPQDFAARLDPVRSHIGLSNVAFRVRSLCGGSVSLRSRPGEGCRVTVTIPR
ncbi:sensor histidine kinase [Gordonibacter massiliensis (ex Traore et al. 2017)]|uniref:sensor histidine kinase n=1 Tax=Gordonibacter massiliensis (ex Traore et al. 2017) TaxID=1841863 RepID=UPI001C8C02BB|nr:histidine kinase [Gordonibacter massiliensis (ex Traore et al. 2017)]MBX9032777.1 histidine kinase [Gordonibacter massiliensis (ex Traore et al. 2017)]